MASNMISVIALLAIITFARGQLSDIAQVITNNEVIVLKNSNIELHLLKSGAVVQRLLVPDANGVMGDVALGFDSVDPYLNGTSPYFGATVGRVANRIKAGNFSLNGQNYSITLNDGAYGNALHGGVIGWNKLQWQIISQNSTSVKLYVISPNGDQGFPGTVNATVQFTLRAPSTVDVQFTATSDAPTPVNMAQHTYFNLNGVETASTILNNTLQVNSSYITPTDQDLIPTGAFQAVNGTGYDLSQPTQIGSRIQSATGVASDPGFDVNYVLWGRTGQEALQMTQNCRAFDTPALAATVHSPISGRTLQLYTNSPGLQVYTAGQLKGAFAGKNGVVYPQFAALVLETQVFPDFPNQPGFPQCTISPGNSYSTALSWVFSASNATSVTG